jgi:hypothetical protein
MNAGLAADLGALLFAAVGGLTLLVKLLNVQLQAKIDDAVHAARRAETNSNGKLDALIAENIRLRLEIDQLRAIIHSVQE